MMVAVGDFHIPNRADRIPGWIAEFVKRADVVACTGDLCSEDVLRELEGLARELYVVRGNMDGLDLPETQTFTYKGVRIGLFHGTGVVPRGDWDQLLKVAQRLGVDVLIVGHTHHWAAYEYKGIVFVNPGSATGAWGGSSEGGPESLATLEVADRRLTVRIYNDEKLVHEQSFTLDT